MASQRLRLGQLLVDARMLTQEALDEVLASQKEDGRRLGVLLVERGLVNETQLTQILSHQLAVPWVSLLHIEFSRQLLNLVPHDVAEKYCLVPIYVRNVRGQGETVYVAMDDPSNEEGLRECQTFSGLPVRAMIAPPSDIRSAIRVYYGAKASSPAPAVALPPASDAPPPAAPLPAAASPVAVSLPPVELPPAKPARPPAAPLPLAAPQKSPPAPDMPTIETREIVVPPRGSQKLQQLMAEKTEDAPPSSEREVDTIPLPKGPAPRMVALTLLDGTTLTLPAQGRKPRRIEEPVAPRRPPEALKTELLSEDGGQLTARDLVAALKAVAHGADASEILGRNPSWEPMFAAILSLLLKKHLIADWEFVEEFTAAGGGRRRSDPPRGGASG